MVAFFGSKFYVYQRAGRLVTEQNHHLSNDEHLSAGSIAACAIAKFAPGGSAELEITGDFNRSTVYPGSQALMSWNSCRM